MQIDDKTLDNDEFEAEEDVPLFLYTYNFKPSLLEDSKQTSSFSPPGKTKNTFTRWEIFKVKSFSEEIFKFQHARIDSQCCQFATDYLLYQNHKIPTLGFRYPYISNVSIWIVLNTLLILFLVKAGGSKTKTKHIELEADA